MNKAGRVILTVVTPLVRLLFPFKVKGRERVPSAQDCPRLILCSNHISIIDPVFLLVAQKRAVRFMAKAELFRNPVLRWLLGRMFGAFAVNRGKGDTGALDTARELVEQGELMGIFPEGTRSKDGRLGRAKSGAALIASQTGAAILPVAIVTKNQKVRLFRRTTIVFGEIITPEELHLRDAEHPELRYASRLLMERIGGLIGEAGMTV